MKQFTSLVMNFTCTVYTEIRFTNKISVYKPSSHLKKIYLKSWMVCTCSQFENVNLSLGGERGKETSRRWWR